MNVNFGIVGGYIVLAMGYIQYWNSLIIFCFIPDFQKSFEAILNSWRKGVLLTFGKLTSANRNMSWRQWLPRVSYHGESWVVVMEPICATLLCTMHIYFAGMLPTGKLQWRPMKKTNPWSSRLVQARRWAWLAGLDIHKILWLSPVFHNSYRVVVHKEIWLPETFLYKHRENLRQNIAATLILGLH